MIQRHRTLGAIVAELVSVNVELWHREDEARATDDATVATAKRAINDLNNRRNALIEEIDALVSYYRERVPGL